MSQHTYIFQNHIMILKVGAEMDVVFVDFFKGKFLK